MSYKLPSEILTLQVTTAKNIKSKHQHIYDTDYNNKVYVCSCGKKKKMV